MCIYQKNAQIKYDENFITHHQEVTSLAYNIKFWWKISDTCRYYVLLAWKAAAHFKVENYHWNMPVSGSAAAY